MAPNTPYDDNQMKEFFELVLTVFEKVSSSSGECYTKMIKVIETLSSGEYAVMMCHLQLNGLIVRLFKWFLTAAGSSSSDVVSKMEKIMTMIIKESKELPHELVNLLAMNGKSSKEIASPVRVQLAKKVLKNYADQLNPDIPDTTVSEKKTLAIVETPMPSKSVTTVNGKRKKQIQSVEHGKNLVGSRIKVWWPEDNTYYEGTVKSFQSHNKRHKVWYDDGDDELIDLKTEKWELVEDVSPMLDYIQSVEHGENLVGSRIRVWWPEDKTYYEGTVKSFQSHNKRHKVWYDDGDDELIDLKTQKWELVEDVSPIPEWFHLLIAAYKLQIEARLDQVVITLASGDRGQGFDPHSLQGRRSFSIFGRTGSSLSTLSRGMAVYVSTSPIHRATAQSAEHGENLVGRRIKVWWPADKSYYEGVVESFDRSKKKHKVLYDDGDEDVLNLNQRQWTLIEDVSAIEPVPD
ncbi:phospholipase-like protein, partial [Tanacetum coccineum]